jgi:CHAT domain-containing protein
LASSQLQFADRFLTARDIVGIPGGLRADLVLLNACQSGRFDTVVRGEVEGFLRGFLIAGAAAMIATLLEVDPEASKQIALGFYREWLQGQTKSEALRRAQLAVRQKRSDPEYWAYHVLVGSAV